MWFWRRKGEITKGNEETLQFSILIVVMISWEYTYVISCQVVYIKYVQFIVSQLYLSEAISKLAIPCLSQRQWQRWQNKELSSEQLSHLSLLSARCLRTNKVTQAQCLLGRTCLHLTCKAFIICLLKEIRWLIFFIKSEKTIFCVL